MTAVRDASVTEVSEALGTGTVIATVPGRGHGGAAAIARAIIGAIIVIALWEILALTVFHKVGSGVPRPFPPGRTTSTANAQYNNVLTQLWHDWQAGHYGKNIGTTMKEAITGYIDANVLAIVLGVLFVLWPVVESALLRIAIASYCLPIIAIGPILIFTLHGDAPKSALAALLVFFPSLIGVVVGLRSADKTSLEVIRAVGGGTRRKVPRAMVSVLGPERADKFMVAWAQLVKVRLRAALPSTFAALQIAAPSAILGAIIGEYLGAQTQGLGVFMIVAEQQGNAERLWGIALVCTVIAGLAYAVIGLIGRLVTPWAPRRRSA
ncbi:MAG TPA: ABC transporter permease subunit [Acidimicrobiales bacterium]|nr:ABC transporter permease subunit [Acidimicrobiales bacterium]